MRKTLRLKSAPHGIDPSVLSAISGGATLSVGNLLLSIGVSDSTAGNIDTALQLGPR